MKNRMTTLLLVSLLTAGGHLLADRIPLEKGTAEFAIPGSERIRFDFQHRHADIEITGQDSNQVRVEVENGGHQEFPSYLDWDADKRNVRLDLEHVQGSGKVRIWLPANSAINLQTVESNVKATDIRGDAIVRLVNGDIQLDGLSGAILVELVNGNSVVRPLVSESTAPISIMSQNGNIRLVVPEDFKASATASTVHGKINNDLPDNATAANQEDGRHGMHMGPMSRQTVQINGGGRQVTLKTVNGNITLTTP